MVDRDHAVRIAECTFKINEFNVVISPFIRYSGTSAYTEEKMSTRYKDPSLYLFLCIKEVNIINPERVVMKMTM